MNIGNNIIIQQDIKFYLRCLLLLLDQFSCYQCISHLTTLNIKLSLLITHSTTSYRIGLLYPVITIYSCAIKSIMPGGQTQKQIN